MYGIDNSVQSESGFKTIAVGIQENCSLKSINFDKSSDKEGAAKVLIFNFTQEGGGAFRHLEFPIDVERERTNAKKYYEKLTKEGKKPKEELPEYVDTYVKRVFKDQASRIKHIMSKFIPEEKTLISGVNTFEAFSRAVIAAVGTSAEGVKVRLKLVYNNKDYVTFPKYPNFIEVQTDAPSTLKWNPKFDRSEKLAPDAPSAPSTDDEY